MDKKRILILGGTAEARELAGRLAARGDLEVTLSLAGRTLDPAPQPVPVRTGGFGGADGLAGYLAAQQIDLLVDATHPFARQISANAERAAELVETPILRLQRPGWQKVEGDRWTCVATLQDAVAALGEAPMRVFLAIGRQETHHVNAAPQHAYLVRSVDPVEPPLTVPHATYLLARGPFTVDDEIALLRDHRIDALVSKNSGGAATYAKIAAARVLGLPVVMVERTASRGVATAETIDGILSLIDHVASGGRKRGV
ncbi:cobalt-precorrin-6A reductase [Rhizobium sp. GN54]|uniref:cobalt-precorrin-6A reductase n=1 Tax=Rhizobium sp. GN54 TaxID=2898150 RepID=UPI001E3C84E3|nr:cobalt-precorrin-6A reductase [Rhizobium sp. GN54]MCD2182538.1 cobalt-precorrin-6A reductase [Rhizobium sp. GN54]